MKTNTTTTTTAALLLALVFEHHQIRTVWQDGKWRFYRNDIAAALGIIHVRKSINLHLDPDELGVTKVTVRSANGTEQIREVATLTESGVIALVCSSRKPAARRFRRWLTDVVFPQLFTYGTFFEGASEAEQLMHLHRRWQIKRAASIASSETTLAESGHLPFRAFMQEHAIPARDIPAIASKLQVRAKADGITPTQVTLRGYPNPTNAWPRELLAAAVNSTTPRLF